MATSYSFQGWLALDSKGAQGGLVHTPFQPKEWTEHDIDIRVTHCGMCGTDMHTLRDGMGSTIFPCCVGHEIVGVVVRAGKETDHSIGSRVGVGPQSDNCDQADCLDCSRGRENYCPRSVMTYSGRYKDGGISQGGYSSHCRIPGKWAFKLPDGLSSAYAAPMLCAGLTVYTPLVRAGTGPGKAVGVIGLGGLGHFAVIFARAMGCSVVVISRTQKKAEDAIKMGADTYIATLEDLDWAQKHASTLDLIIDTTGAIEEIPQLLVTMRAEGEIVLVGAPRAMEAKINPWLLLFRGIKYRGSVTGTRREVEQMLQFAVKHNVQPWVEERPMAEVNDAIIDFEAQKPRYRYVLVNAQV